MSDWLCHFSPHAGRAAASGQASNKAQQNGGTPTRYINNAGQHMMPNQNVYSKNGGARTPKKEEAPVDEEEVGHYQVSKGELVSL